MICNRLIIRVKKGFTVLCACLVACLVLDSCGSSKNTVSGSEALRVEKSKGKKSDSKKTKKPKAGRGASHALADALVDEARSWLGTPYRYGGKTKKGADCSGFIMEVYRNVAGISIPRNSAKQKEYCADIDKMDLTVGDLIFFSSKRSGGGIAHVGMYIGDGMMIHASSSRGVVESPIDQRYYVEHYKGSGRIPLIAELVPVKRSSKPSDKPVPDDPQYAAVDKPAKPISTSKNNPPHDAKLVRVEDVGKLLSVKDNGNEPTATSSADNRSTAAEPRQIAETENPESTADLVTVTVASAFEDTETTRRPLTAKRTAAPAAKKISNTEKNVEPTKDDATGDANKLPATVVVRTAFGVSK